MAASDDSIQCVEQIFFRRRRYLGLSKMTEHVAYNACGSHDDVHDVLSQGELGGAQFVEQIFGAVAQFHQFVDIEKTRPALDRVEAAKNVVEQGFVSRPFLQFNQLVVHIGQELACFHEEILKQFFHSGEMTHDFSRNSLLMLY